MHPPNNIQLVNPLTGRPGHFSLHEFANADGLTCIHPSTLVSLELTRRDLCLLPPPADIQITITNAIRTQADLDSLAARYAWVDHGGTVSRNSMHLVTFGGIAVDILARRTTNFSPIAQDILADICRPHWSFVRADYPDGHVHCDNRNLL